MKNIKWKSGFLIIFVALASFLVYLLFLDSKYFEVLDNWVVENQTTFIIYLFTFKTFSILWPPLTGGLATVAAIPFLGWFRAYLIDFLGSVIGGSMCFFLGKKYGFRLLDFLLDKSIVERLKSVKVRKEKEIEAVIIYRVFFGGTLIEAIYYGAGLLKIGFKNFLVGATVSHIIVGIPTFYFARNIFDRKYILFFIISLALGIPFFIKFRRRHLEWLK